MTTTRLCNQCGKPLAGGDSDSSCPSCLLEWGLDAPLDDPPPSASDVESGERNPSLPSARPRLTYFGDYELIEEIARGGMGVVYKARQVSLNRLVAVKMILAGHFAGRDAVERFKIEAMAAAKLRHPRIVGIHEVGECEGFHYFSMDYIEGRSLSDAAREGPVPPRQAAEWLREIAEAIHYAHEQGVLHRDLKPSNILLNAADEPHVTDFGLAKMGTNIVRDDVKVVPTGQIDDLTLSGQVLGTPNYMPPEQVTGKRGVVGRAGDVYSLGAVLYHLLTGRPPVAGANVAETLHQVLHGEVVSPRLLNPSTPEDLETICLKCLEKEPERRYPTARELAEELNRFLNHEPILARPVSAPEKLRRWCRRKPVVAGLLAGLLAVFSLGFGGVVWQWRRAAGESEAKRQQVAQLNVLNGVQLMQGGDYFKALLWFAEALRTDAGNAAHEEPHRMRLASVIAESPRLIQLITHDGQPIVNAAFSPTDDQLATIGMDRTVRLWEIPSGQLRLRSDPLPAVPFAIAFSPDGAKLAVTLLDNTVRVLDAGDLKEAFPRLPHHLEGEDAILPVFDAAGEKLITQPEPSALQVVEVKTGRAIGRRITLARPLTRAQFSADGSRVFTRTTMPTNQVWNANTGEPMAFHVSGSDAVEPLFASTRGDAALVGGNLWRWSKGPASMVPVSMAESWNVTDAAFSPDGTRLLTGRRDRTALIYDVTAGQPITPALAHDQVVSRCAWSPDGRSVLTVSWDNQARVWDADTGHPLTPPLAHAAGSRGGGFSGSGRYLLTVHPEYAACVWDLRRESTPPILLKPLRAVPLNESGRDGERFLSREANALIRVRGASGMLNVSLHPISLKQAPKQAWFDASGRFVALEGEMARVQIWDAASGLPLTPLVPSDYSLDESAYTKVTLSSLDLEVTKTVLLAELLSGSRLDGTGGWTLLKIEELTAAWETLRRERPELFRARDTARESWHREQAEAAEGALDWSAAAFHWAALEALKAGETTARQRREFAEQCRRHAAESATNYVVMRSATPLRDPRADARLIDLSAHPLAKGTAAVSFRAVATGARTGWQMLGSVAFDTRAKLSVFGSEAAARGRIYPERIDAILIQRRAERLHFLHTANWVGTVSDQAEIASFTVHYSDGEAVRIPIRRGLEIADEWGVDGILSKETQIVKVWAEPQANAFGTSLKRVKYAWSNPHPEREISHLVLVSAKTTAEYHLHGLTVE